MRLRMIVAVLVMLAATACARTEPPSPPVPLEPSELDRRVYWAADLNGKLVSIEGYIGFDNGPDGQAIAVGPELTTEPLGEGDELIGLDVKRGDGPNQLQAPVLETKTMANFPAAPPVLVLDVGRATFKDQAGKAHPLREKVRATGRLTYIRVGDVGLWSDEDSRSPTGRRFKVRLTDVVLDEPVR
jgi:hypothetical protein